MGSNLLCHAYFALLCLAVFQKETMRIAHFSAAMLREHHLSGFHHSSILFLAVFTLVLGALPALHF